LMPPMPLSSLSLLLSATLLKGDPAGKDNGGGKGGGEEGRRAVAICPFWRTRRLLWQPRQKQQLCPPHPLMW
jgi:hypothetical protein